MKLRYIGPHDGVDLAGHGTVMHGKTVDVTGPVATSLARQADWERVSAPKTRTTKTKPATGKNGPTAENEEE